MEVIKPDTTVIYQVSKRAKPVVGKVAEMCWMNGGFRYKIMRKEKGRFLYGKTVGEALRNPDGLYVEDTRWVFQVWLKRERIIKIL